MAVTWNRISHHFSVSVAIFAALCGLLIILPFHPEMPRVDQDASWPLAMNAATARGMVFGRDIVFTGGPYLSIYTRQFFPGTERVMWLGTILIAFAVLAAVLASVPPRNRMWLSLLPALLTMPGIRDALFLNLPWLLVLTAVHAPRSRHALYLGVVYGMVVSCALLPLVKGSFTPATVACIGIAAYIVGQQCRSHALLIPLTFMCAIAAAWLCVGQPLRALPAYFAAQAEVVAGYGDAMSVSGPLSEVVFLVLGCSLLVLAALRGTNVYKWPIAAATALSLFVDFKAGVVRHDGHIALSAVSVVLVAGYFMPLSRGRGATCVSAFAACLGLYILSGYSDMSIGGTYSRIKRELGNSVAALAGSCAGDAQYMDEYQHAVASIRSALPLPGQGKTVDLYTSEASAVVLGTGRWTPRPVFQSYAAYTPALVERNVSHLREAGPERIFWRVQTIDNRYPALDDGKSWLWLLGAYHPTGYVSKYLQIDRQATVEPLLTGAELINEYPVAGDAVDLPRDTALWASVDLQPSLLGRLRAVVYKPPPVSMTLRYSDGAISRFRVVAGMMRTGFLLSPTVLSTDDLVQFWTKGYRSLPVNRQPVSLSIDLSAGDSIWFARRYHLSVSRLSVPQVPPPPRSLDPVEPLPFDSRLGSGGQCNIDEVDGMPLSGATVHTKASIIMLVGWAVADASSGKASEATYIRVQDSSGVTRYIRTRSTPRADVAKAFKQSSLTDSGFEAVISLSDLIRPVAFSVVTVRNKQYFECLASKARVQ